MTQIYWHIAHPSYTGGDLICRNELERAGVAPEWGWGEDAPEGFDGDVVCLFPDTEQGREEADWLWYEHPEYALLRIDIPEDSDRSIVHVAEGYPALNDRIDGAWITEVKHGYTEGAIV